MRRQCYRTAFQSSFCAENFLDCGRNTGALIFQHLMDFCIKPVKTWVTLHRIFRGNFLRIQKTTHADNGECKKALRVVNDGNKVGELVGVGLPAGGDTFSLKHAGTRFFWLVGLIHDVGSKAKPAGAVKSRPANHVCTCFEAAGCIKSDSGSIMECLSLSCKQNLLARCACSLRFPRGFEREPSNWLGRCSKLLRVLPGQNIRTPRARSRKPRFQLRFLFSFFPPSLWSPLHHVPRENR